MKGNIFDIKHFAVHDGPGIRTTVFFKGCPLKCVWCHNPESISKSTLLGYVSQNCTACQRCARVCPTGAHTVENGTHAFSREKCIKCGKCAEVCYGKNLTLYGREATVEQIISDVLVDEDFYESSGGGITLSGGECLIQADFCEELLKAAKEKGLHTAVDTSGFAPRESLEKVVPYTDLFLYDVKAFDEEVHKRCTGVSNKIILDNLIYLDGIGAQIEIRIPLVPEYNTTEIEKIGGFLKDLKSVLGVRILPYHNYALTKYESLGMENTLPEKVPTEEEISAAEKALENLGIKVLR